MNREQICHVGWIVWVVVSLSGCTQESGKTQQVKAGAVTNHAAVVAESRELAPSPPWPAGDQRGMANTLGAGTWLRCAYHLTQPDARAYELAHVRSNDMTQSPFGVPLKYKYHPTKGVPGTRHAWNGEELISGAPGAQGTQMDAHWAIMGTSTNPGTVRATFPQMRRFTTVVIHKQTSSRAPIHHCSSSASRTRRRS